MSKQLTDGEIEMCITGTRHMVEFWQNEMRNSPNEGHQRLAADALRTWTALLEKLENL